MAADPTVSLDPDPRIKRVHCIAGVDLEVTREGAERPGHISVVIVPARRNSEGAREPDAELVHHVRTKLEKHRLVTTRVHVSPPSYVPVRLKAALLLTGDVQESQVRHAGEEALDRFFDPVGRRSGDHGWPFGRAVFLSEVYDLLERLPGVDDVSALEVDSGEPARIMRNDVGQVVGIALRGHELPLLEIRELATRFPALVIENRQCLTRSSIICR
jgi:hypothetical protein